ncbi:MAG: hypothetical protein QW733_06440 [Desulfurococcaceae archaeon]
MRLRRTRGRKTEERGSNKEEKKKNDKSSSKSLYHVIPRRNFQRRKGITDKVLKATIQEKDFFLYRNRELLKDSRLVKGTNDMITKGGKNTVSLRQSPNEILSITYQLSIQLLKVLGYEKYVNAIVPVELKK